MTSATVAVPGTATIASHPVFGLGKAAATAPTGAVMAGALSLPHDGTEALYTVLGVGMLALGHQLNSIAGE